MFVHLNGDLMLNLDENSNVLKKGAKSSKFFIVSSFLYLLTDHKLCAQYAAKLKRLQGK